MTRHVSLVVALATVFAGIVRADGSASGRITGIVRDDRGQAVHNASIVAVGSTFASVRSDTLGRFSLALSPGDYIVRATRDGYVSTYKETFRVHASMLVEREITLTRQISDATPVALTGTDDHAHSEAAWRLRHLPRTVLRDTAGSYTTVEPVTEYKPDVSFLNWAREGSARAASFFTETDFSGQLNFVTTSTATSLTRWLPSGGPRGIAYVSVGAPIGSHGAWRVRGTMAAGDLSSWAVLGEYQAHDDRPHAVTLGFKYSTQGYVSRGGAAQTLATASGRSVGGIYGYDRWRFAPRVTLDYGLRIDRYDYTTPHDLLSPRAGLRLQALPRTFVRGGLTRRMVAPGADEFLPPASAGLWLPPERTFSTLVSGAPFRVEQLFHREVALEHELGRSGTARVLSVVLFRQDAINQVATLFKSGTTPTPGHYSVATPGRVVTDGWIARLSGQLVGRLYGTIEYSEARSAWTLGPSQRLLSFRAPSVVRPARELIHDVTATLETYIPESSTRISFAYRFNTAYSRARWMGREPAPGQRFHVQIHQALPYQPIRDGRLEAVFAIRTLFRDAGDVRPFYDELLTVAPPLRLMGGVQVKF
jgi:hypothetical protein